VSGQGDSGAADARLAAALGAWRAEPSAGAAAQVLAALTGARVLAAITATSTAEHVEEGTGLRAESSAEMALLTLVRGEERALPVFTSIEALRRWRLDARPVVVPGEAVALAALEQGATTVLLDLVFAVDGADLQALAQGYLPVAGSTLATRRTSGEIVAPATPPSRDLLVALAQALALEPVSEARLLEGPDGPVLGVVPDRALTPVELAELARRLVARLGDRLPAAGLDLAVVAPGGPGSPVPRRTTRRLLRRGR
jgi:hypothetical protein